jgi:hypothetical protein
LQTQLIGEASISLGQLAVFIHDPPRKRFDFGRSRFLPRELRCVDLIFVETIQNAYDI